MKQNASITGEIRILLRPIMLAASVLLSAAATPHDHAEGPPPKGGRLLEKTEPHAELVIETDRRVTIHFYDHQMKPVEVTTQSVRLIAEVKPSKVILECEKRSNVLVSKGQLPEGKPYTLVAQFRQHPDAKPTNYRLIMDMSRCGECRLAEYACTCRH